MWSNVQKFMRLLIDRRTTGTFKVNVLKSPPGSHIWDLKTRPGMGRYDLASWLHPVTWLYITVPVGRFSSGVRPYCTEYVARPFPSVCYLHRHPDSRSCVANRIQLYSENIVSLPVHAPRKHLGTERLVCRVLAPDWSCAS
jgi:hypothetical protein